MRRVEQSAIWVGGLLCHYVTDLSQPLHTSVHIFGWSTTVPNPGDFRPQNIHGAFEGFADRCVRDRRITKSQVAKQIGEPRQVDDWLAHVASAIQESNQHVERVFELEQQGLFKSCAEDSDAVTFTVARMAVGAALLRDLWFAAWNRSR